MPPPWGNEGPTGDAGGERGAGLSALPLPSNVQAERALLGGLLSNNKAFDLIRPGLSHLHFFDGRNAMVFQAIAKRVSRGQLADGVTLVSELDGASVLQDVGGAAYIARLLASMVSPKAAREYSEAIWDCWVRREAIHIAQGLVDSCYSGADGPTGADGIVSEAIGQMLSLGEEAQRGAGSAVTMSEAVASAIADSEAVQRGVAAAMSLNTGINSIDDLWGGLWPGQLYYVIARSRTGKSPLMAQIARAVAGRLFGDAPSGAQPEYVHVFSLEMAPEDYSVVNLAQTTRWTSDQIKRGDFGGADDWIALHRAGAHLKRLPILIDSEARMGLATLLTRARVARRTHRTRLILIDHREIVGRPPDCARMSQVEWMPHLGYELKGLAKALGIPVVLFCQTNRPKGGAPGEEAPRPTLDDLPYGGETAADGVFALWRRELGVPEDPPDSVTARTEEARLTLRNEWYARRRAMRGQAEFGALKRRFGPTGWHQLRFDGPRVTFSDAPPGQEPLPELRAPDLWDAGLQF